MRQGPDTGTQYRSAIFWTDPEHAKCAETQAVFQKALGTSQITTEIVKAPAFYMAENEHQQYLAKHPNGYCSMQGCAVDVDFSNL